jgi:acetyl-CoA carboxylase biotin carboxyl carrier protein
MAKKEKSGSPPGGGPRGVDFNEVERLLAFMEKHGLEEFEYERDGVRVRLKKPSTHTQGVVRTFPAHESAGAGAHTAGHSGATAHSGTPGEAAPGAGRAEDLHIIKSPIVGTFYASASPESEPFVKVGAQVESGQALCIIEAMKLMNEIESDVAGEVVRVFVENGQPVEYGEPLFGIHPQRKK